MARRNVNVQKRDGAWWARITWLDPVTGRRREQRRKADSAAEAKELVESLKAELVATDGSSAEHHRDTFSDLAGYFAEHYLTPAEYVDGRKVSGLRSLYTVQKQLTVLREHFGKTRLRSITYGQLRTFRAHRLRTPTRNGGQRTIATVNRELTLLKRMFNVATREGWIMRNPFTLGDPLVSLADERHRERIITEAEEVRLLAACCHPQRLHLRPIIICALYTGMRQGEILKLRWADVDFTSKAITVQSMNTKTLRARQIEMPPILERELRSLYDGSKPEQHVLVFGITDNVKRSFTAARNTAGLPDVRFHDLRHTAATRLVRGELPLAEVGRILGHTQPKTTYRYVNADASTASRAAAIFHDVSQRVEQVVAAEPVN